MSIPRSLCAFGGSGRRHEEAGEGAGLPVGYTASHLPLKSPK